MNAEFIMKSLVDLGRILPRPAEFYVDSKLLDYFSGDNLDLSRMTFYADKGTAILTGNGFELGENAAVSFKKLERKFLQGMLKVGNVTIYMLSPVASLAVEYVKRLSKGNPTSASRDLANEILKRNPSIVYEAYKQLNPTPVKEYSQFVASLGGYGCFLSDSAFLFHPQIPIKGDSSGGVNAKGVGKSPAPREDVDPFSSL